MSDLKRNEHQQEYHMAMCAVDAFAKFASVVPFKSNNAANLLDGLKETFKNLGGAPMGHLLRRGGGLERAARA